jgi:DNA mismatch endonuclease (patch repair protein)
MMSGIRSKDTKPEMIVRKGLHARGFRFRLHDRTLPGKPDLVLRRYNAVIFVHGCFWHGHDCHLFKTPKSRRQFWAPKIASNKDRDSKTHEALVKSGWRVAEVWECATKGRTRLDPDAVIETLSDWIKGDRQFLCVAGG